MIARSGSALVGLLGLSVRDARVTGVLAELGVAAPPPAPDRPRYAVAPAHGLEFLFKPPYQLRDPDSLDVAPDELVLSTVFFHAQGHEDHTAYAGDLPYGLRFDLSVAAVTATLAPLATPDPRRRHNWSLGRAYVAVGFTGDGQGITLVCVGLPWSDGVRTGPRPDPRREAAVELVDRLEARDGPGRSGDGSGRSGDAPPELAAFQRELAGPQTPFFADVDRLDERAITLTPDPPGALHYVSCPPGAGYERFFADVRWIGEDQSGALIGYWKAGADTFIGAPVIRIDNEGCCEVVGASLVDYCASIVADEQPLVDLCRRAGLPEPRAEDQPAVPGRPDPDEVITVFVDRELAHIRTSQPTRPLDRWPMLVTLADGRVVVVSNEDDIAANRGSGGNAAFLFDPAVRRFQALPPTARRLSLHGGGVGRLPDGRAVFAETSRDTYCVLFDPDTTTWYGGTRLEARHIGAGAALLPDGRVLVAGGEEEWTRPVTRCDVYDPATDAWSGTGELAVARSHLALAPVAGGALAVGGCLPGRGMDASDSCERYDAAAGTWTAAAPLPFAMKMPTALVLSSGLVFVVSIHEGWALYDPSRDAWTRSRRQHHARRAAAELAGDRVALFGVQPDHPPETVLVLDVTTGDVTAAGRTQLPRGDSAAAALPDGAVLLVGGDLFDNLSKEPEVWEPATGRGQAPPGLAPVLGRQVRNLAAHRSIPDPAG